MSKSNFLFENFFKSPLKFPKRLISSFLKVKSNPLILLLFLLLLLKTKILMFLCEILKFFAKTSLKDDGNRNLSSKIILMIQPTV